MSHNKFLEKYPQLIEPKIGDKVITIRKCENAFSHCNKGVTGIIYKIDNEYPEYLIVVDDPNPHNEVYRHWISREDFSIII
jgi:hypothetical protein